jgi:hypothetical protein
MHIPRGGATPAGRGEPRRCRLRGRVSREPRLFSTFIDLAGANSLKKRVFQRSIKVDTGALDLDFSRLLSTCRHHRKGVFGSVRRKTRHRARARNPRERHCVTRRMCSHYVLDGGGPFRFFFPFRFVVAGHGLALRFGNPLVSRERILRIIAHALRFEVRYPGWRWPRDSEPETARAAQAILEHLELSNCTVEAKEPPKAHST